MHLKILKSTLGVNAYRKSRMSSSIYIAPCFRATSKQKDVKTKRQYAVVRSSFCFDVSGSAKQRNFSSVVLKMNNDQEESVSSAVYRYDTSINAAFFENFSDYREGYIILL